MYSYAYGDNIHVMFSFPAFAFLSIIFYRQHVDKSGIFVL